MSLSVQATDGQVETNFVGIPIEAVAIGEYEIPLEHFCYMAGHYLCGGFFGWGGETPECVNTTLTALFNLYAKAENGKWVRKSFKELGGVKK